MPNLLHCSLYFVIVWLLNAQISISNAYYFTVSIVQFIDLSGQLVHVYASDRLLGWILIFLFVFFVLQKSRLCALCLPVSLFLSEIIVEDYVMFDIDKERSSSSSVKIYNSSSQLGRRVQHWPKRDLFYLKRNSTWYWNFYSQHFFFSGLICA